MLTCVFFLLRSIVQNPWHENAGAYYSYNMNLEHIEVSNVNHFEVSNANHFEKWTWKHILCNFDLFFSFLKKIKLILEG